MAIGLFDDEDELRRLGMEAVIHGDLGRDRKGVPFFKYGDLEVLIQGNDDIYITGYVGDARVRMMTRDASLVDLARMRIREAASPVTPIAEFTTEHRELVGRARDLAKAMDISPTAAHRLIEMKTEYDVVRYGGDEGQWDKELPWN